MQHLNSITALMFLPYIYVKGVTSRCLEKVHLIKLIYPVPEKSGAGLGVHSTIDLGGQVKFGPNVEYIKDEDYAVTSDLADAYYSSISRYYPALKQGVLVPAYAGIRPKLQGPDDPVKDFVIQGPQETWRRRTGTTIRY